MGRQVPASVTMAIRAQVALVAASAVVTLLTVVRRDELVAAFRARQAADVEPPAFVPVAIVLFFTFALLAAVLTAFFRDGQPPARVALLVLAVFVLFTMVVMVQQSPPVEFSVLAVVCGLLDLVVVASLLHRDTSEFLRGSELAERVDEA